MGLLGPAHPSLLWAVPAYAGDERFEGHCRRKDYFVVTSNGEGHFELCGFDPTKIYEIEGNWITMQCARPCHDTLYSSLEVAENYRLPNRAAMCLQSWCRVVPSAEVPWTSTWARVRE